MLTTRLSYMKKRIRIDIEDAEGTKYDIKLDGNNITKDKILKVFDMMNILNTEEEMHPAPSTINTKIWKIVDKYYSTGKFTSSNILEKYEDEYNEPIKLSVISTYLSRFTNNGKVQRDRKGREWTYQTPLQHIQSN